MNNIPHQIKTLRKAQKLFQRELAEKSGLSKTAIIQIERGHAEPTIHNLEKIANALGCDLEIRMTDIGAKESLQQSASHWHELFCEHYLRFEGELTRDDKFMLGYYSGRKDGALEGLKIIEKLRGHHPGAD